MLQWNSILNITVLWIIKTILKTKISYLLLNNHRLFEFIGGQRMIQFLTNYNSVINIILSLLLVIITGVYVCLTYQLAVNSSESIKQNTKIIERVNNEDERARKNYLQIINEEMIHNYFYYFMFYLFYKSEIGLNIREQIMLFVFKSKTGDDVYKELLGSNLTSKTWHEVKIESSKLLPNEIVTKLAEYYRRLDNLKLTALLGVDQKQVADHAKYQLDLAHKCFLLIDMELGRPNERPLAVRVKNKEYWYDYDKSQFLWREVT